MTESNVLDLDDLMNHDPPTEWEFLLFEPPNLTPTYRIAERDGRSGPKAMLKEGDRITYSRIVTRVGYEFGIHSVTKREWWEAGLRIVAADTGLSVEQVKAVVVSLQHSAPFRGLRNSIYKSLISPMIARSTMPNVRAMWFYDCGEPKRGEIRGSITRLTGKRNDGYYSRGWDGKDNDQPPYLSEAHTQRLYRVTPAARLYFCGKEVWVYPEDATEVSQ